MIEEYEHNLKLYNESIRKDLDILLTSTIPTQKNLMKTLLWINSLIVGFSITALNNQIGVAYVFLPFSFAFVAVLIILLSLKDGRLKTFGTPAINEIESIKENKWMKAQGLANMNKSYKQAFDLNARIVQKRGQKIAGATNLTLLSLSSIFIGFIIYANLLKGG